MDPNCLFSLPFSLPSGDSSKKPTREWEPLSESKVKPACLRSSLCRGLGAGAAAEHGHPHPGGQRTGLPAAPRLTLGLWTEKQGTRGLDPTAGVHVSWGCRCMALHPECP